MAKAIYSVCLHCGALMKWGRYQQPWMYCPTCGTYAKHLQTSVHAIATDMHDQYASTYKERHNFGNRRPQQAPR